MATADLAGKSILIADDDPIIRQVLSAHFQMRGARVLAAASGDEALRIFESEPGSVDLIISDVRMPGGDGMAFLKRVRAKDRVRPPFVMITGFSDYTAEQIREQGACEVLAKPFELSELKVAVARALRI